VTLPVASLVDASRAELKQARASADPDVPFVAGPVPVDINVVAKREGSTTAERDEFVLYLTVRRVHPRAGRRPPVHRVCRRGGERAGDQMGEMTEPINTTAPVAGDGRRSRSGAQRGRGGAGEMDDVRGRHGGAGLPMAALALAVVVFMQLGTLARPLGEVGATRAADWLDLLTPWAVIGAAAWVLVRCRALTAGARPDPLAWVLLAVGGIAFAEGKGVHLAANSVGNAEPVGRAADVASLWDDGVGHWLWYLGLLVLLVAVGRAVLADDGPALLRATPLGVTLAVVTGVSLTNAWIEGATPWLGLAAAAGFAAYGLRHRRRGGTLWVVCFGVALLQLVGWGLYWWIAEGLVFPEYYDVFDWL
jgi:hypothetical protein